MGPQRHQHVCQALDPSNTRGSDTCLPRLTKSCNPIYKKLSEQLDQGEKFYLLQREPPQALNGLVASVATDSIFQASKIVALTEHYRRSLSTDDYSHTSIIDPGASRHVSPDVNILAPDDKVKLTSFTGKETWTSGNGYIPIDCHDDLSGNTFSIDIDNADHSTDTVSTLLSM